MVSSEQLQQLYIYERLHPANTPEIAFQSYELLDGSATFRKAQKTAFLADKVRNPSLDYLYLNASQLKHSIAVLNRLLDETQSIRDETVRDAVGDTISYRMAEMYWLLESKRLNEHFEDGIDCTQSLQRFQDGSEALYGTVDSELSSRVYAEVFAQIADKNLDAGSQKIFDELVNGFTVRVGDEDVVIPKIENTDNSERLPGNIRESLLPLREMLVVEFMDFSEFIDEYYETVCLKRSEGDEFYKKFNPQDMKILFERAHAKRDPDNNSRISIRINDTSSALSWDTPTMSVVIGASRLPISSKKVMFAKMVHEYGVHGMRAVNGQKTNLPILGAGLYTEGDLNEQTDYLTFEEGFATLCEAAILQEDIAWEPLYISRYLAADASRRGLDFRQAFEQNWRIRALMNVKDGEPMTPEIISKDKTQAYISCVRIRRGTPTTLAKGDMPTFNKDLAYLKGKMIALEHLIRIGDDKEAIKYLFKGKFDPTNRIQNSLMTKYQT
jgi:hypothetical protein